MGESMISPAVIGGFFANHTDKVHFLEKTDKKQLVIEWVRVGCNGV